MSDGRQVMRALAIGVIAVALVLGLTRLVTDPWVLLAVALVLQALLIVDRVWRHGGQQSTRRQQADWDAEWDKAWAEQDAQPMRLAASFGPVPARGRMPGMPGMRASSEPFSIMAALSAAHDVLEQCPGWRVVSVQAAGQDGTSARYDLVVGHELTGTIRTLHSEQEWAAFRREMREMRERSDLVLQPGSGHGGELQAR